MSVLETEDPGVFDINENLICAYADLDALIAACGMPDNERHIVEQQMAGYSMGDIATVLGCDGSDIMSLSTQAVKRIAKQNKASWSAMCRR